jgi:hypothetical protein
MQRVFAGLEDQFFLSSSKSTPKLPEYDFQWVESAFGEKVKNAFQKGATGVKEFSDKMSKFREVRKEDKMSSKEFNYHRKRVSKALSELEDKKLRRILTNRYKQFVDGGGGVTLNEFAQWLHRNNPNLFEAFVEEGGYTVKGGGDSASARFQGTRTTSTGTSGSRGGPINPEVLMDRFFQEDVSDMYTFMTKKGEMPPQAAINAIKLALADKLAAFAKSVG